MIKFVKGKRAVTLIELLIVLSIFAVAITSIYAVFRTGIISERRIREHLENYQQIKIATEELSRQLRNAICYPDVKFEGTSQSISFAALLPSESNQREPGKITYTVKQEESLKGLFKEVVLYRDLENSLKPPVQQQVLKDLASLKFSFCYEKDPDTGNFIWEDTFDKEDALPALARLEIEAVAGENKITKFIYIPTGSFKEK